MKNKKIIYLAIFFMSLLAISTVSAGEVDNNVSALSVLETDNDVQAADAVEIDNGDLENHDLRLYEKENNDDNLKLSSDSNILEDNPKGDFTELSNLINNSYGTVLELDRDYEYDGSNEINITGSITIDGKGHSLDANCLTRIFNIESSDVSLKNIVFKNAYSSNSGGAVYFKTSYKSNIIINCSFINCTASIRNGGAVCFDSGGSVINSTFINCSASYDGGAVYKGTVSGSRFVNCSTIYGDGGAVYGTSVENSSFENCFVTGTYSGGAIYCNSKGNIVSCSFMNCSAGYYGGAICFYNGGTVVNSSFMNCSAVSGGAVSGGDVLSSNFLDCFAKSGGAVYSSQTVKINECDFVNCSDSNYCAALYLDSKSSLFNSSFLNGAWYSESAVTIYNVTVNGIEYDFIFDIEKNSQINLTKDYYNVYSPLVVDKENVVIDGMGHTICSGGAYSFYITGNNVQIKNIVFNNSRIYSSGLNLTVFNCSFFNSSSIYGGAVYLIKNASIINCSFLDCSASDGGALCFDYKSCGLVINCSFENCSTSSYNGPGGAIYFNSNGTVRGSTFLNCFTNESGGAIYFSSSNAYKEIVNSSFLDCYAGSGGALYLSGEINILNSNFVHCLANESGGAVYCKSIKLVDSSFINCSADLGFAIYFTSKSNASLSNSSFINNGWYASNPITVSNITVNGIVYDFIFDLKNNSEISLAKDYIVYSYILDANNCVINGNGHAISSFGEQSFYIKGENVIIKNMVFNSSRIYCEGINFTLINCSFINSSASEGGAVYSWYNASVLNCSFIDCRAHEYGGALYFRAKGSLVSNCHFVNCSSAIGGSVFFWNDGNVLNSSFVDCEAEFGGAIFLTSGGNIIASRFMNCSAVSGGALYFDYTDSCIVFASSFVNCSANSGGAIYFIGFGQVKNSSFIACSADYYSGGAICFGDDSNGEVSQSSFINCSAGSGGAVYIYYNSVCSIVNSSFENCSAGTGNATYYGSAVNCTFINYLSEENAVYKTVLENCTFINGVNNDTNVSEPKATVTTVSISPNNVLVNDNVIISPSVTSNGVVIEGTVDILVDGVKVSSVSIGSNYTYVPSSAGKFNIRARFTATDDYNASVSAIVVLNVNSTVPVDNGTENGTGTNATNATEGNGTGSTNATNTTNETNTTVTKLSTSITASKVTATYAVSKKLTVTLKDKSGNKLKNKYVTVKVGTISKKLLTNSNGQVSVDVSGLVPKTYTATIKFAGDSNYIASGKKVTVVVKKANPKITAKAKTFKRTVKTKQYSITLKNNKNNVMKNTKVTIKVNGKTYTAKTNSKGVATFKITKLTKKGSFKSIITYAGSKYYNKVTKTVTIKTT